MHKVFQLLVLFITALFSSEKSLDCQERLESKIQAVHQLLRCDLNEFVVELQEGQYYLLAPIFDFDPSLLHQLKGKNISVDSDGYMVIDSIGQFRFDKVSDLFVKSKDPVMVEKMYLCPYPISTINSNADGLAKIGLNSLLLKGAMSPTLDSIYFAYFLNQLYVMAFNGKHFQEGQTLNFMQSQDFQKQCDCLQDHDGNLFSVFCIHQQCHPLKLECIDTNVTVMGLDGENLVLPIDASAVDLYDAFAMDCSGFFTTKEMRFCIDMAFYLLEECCKDVNLQEVKDVIKNIQPHLVSTDSQTPSLDELYKILDACFVEGSLLKSGLIKLFNRTRDDYMNAIFKCYEGHNLIMLCHKSEPEMQFFMTHENSKAIQNSMNHLIERMLKENQELIHQIALLYNDK